MIPVPIAIVENGDRVLLSNSSFADLFSGVESIAWIPQHEFEMPGSGTYELKSVPLDEEGMKVVYVTEVTNEVQLRRQLVHLEKMAAIGRLVSGVAHELNNPLAGILGYAQLVAQCELEPATRRMVDVILTQAERAGKIVQNLLTLAAKTGPKRIAFDLNDTIRTVIQLREYQESVDNIAITTELSGDLPFAWGDPHQMEQVFLNLIVNAEDSIDHLQREGGSIHVKTAVEGGRIHATVTDNGSGIHALDMARIFDPFFTTKEQQRGTGLGLSICAEIVKDHDGELYVWSTYGSGATFTLELPIKREIEPKEVPPVRALNGKSLTGKRILVIDDEVHITELMFDVLTSQGAATDVANSGMAGLELIKKNNYDVIVCDQRMPGLNGQGLYRLVESLNPEFRHRFLFVTGDVVNAETKRFFARASVPYIRKPFRIHELVDAIEALF